MKRLVGIALLLALVLSLCLPLSAEQPLPTPGQIADDILSFLCAADGVSDVQAFVTDVLPGMVGAGGEWYAIALRQRDSSLDFSTYTAALADYVRAGVSGGAVTEQRVALAFLAVGGGEYYVTQTAQSTVGALGHMSYVYGLHLLNNGVLCDAYTTDSLIDVILSAQLPDGGFAVSGTVGDPDVTAMTLQALAPHVEREAVAAAVDAALAALSAMQQPTGDFISYGVPCPESGAQLLVALSALGIAYDDVRFVKEGNTLLDGILRYRLPDGSFCHTEGGAYNLMATVQCFFAMVALERAQAGAAPMYRIDRTEGVADLTLPQEDTPPVIDVVGEDSWLASLHPAVRIVVVLLALILVAWIIYALCEHCSAKKLLSVLVVIALLIAVVLLIDVQPADEYYSGEHKEKQNPIGTVTLSVSCESVVGQKGTEHLPADGMLLQPTPFAIEQGDTAFVILTEAAAAYGLRLNHTGVTAKSSALAYVCGINDLSEFDHGSLSGWTYLINGQRPSIGCGEYELCDGDTIVFYYTTELGGDWNE